MPVYTHAHIVIPWRRITWYSTPGRSTKQQRQIGEFQSSLSLSVSKFHLYVFVVGIRMAPQLRGLLQRKLAREILTAVGLGLVAGAGYWYALVLPRRRRYEDFYRNYDAKAVAQSMTASFEEGALQMGKAA